MYRFGGVTAWAHSAGAERSGIRRMESRHPQSTEQDELLCRLAHDLNNKLAVVLGCCDLLEDVVEGAEGTRLLATIRDNAEAMARELRRRQCRPPESEGIRTGPWIWDPPKAV